MAYPYEQKKKIVETVAKLVAEGASFYAACRKADIPHKTVGVWIGIYEGTEGTESTISIELKKIYDQALEARHAYLDDLAEQGLIMLLRPHIEETEYIDHLRLKDENDNYIRDEKGFIKTEPVMERVVRKKMMPELGAIQTRLKRHPDYKEGGNGLIGGNDEIMDWSEPDQPGTRIVK